MSTMSVDEVSRSDQVLPIAVENRRMRDAVERTTVRFVNTRRSDRLTDLHMIVLSWINFHPGHTPEDIANGLRTEEDVDEIARLCADLAAAWFIEPTT